MNTSAVSIDETLTAATIRRWFPGGTIGDVDRQSGLFAVVDVDEKSLGFVTTTSPQGDRSLGFSGPTKTLLALDPDLKLIGCEILESRDTREHVQVVREAAEFWEQFLGLDWQELSQLNKIDGVSGATLTSLAIGESLIARTGGVKPQLRFPEPIDVADVSGLFPAAAELIRDVEHPFRWTVLDTEGTKLGEVLSTSPLADSVIGYQGPSRTLIAITTEGTISRIQLNRSYDNEPYTEYLNEDWSFPELFKGLTLENLKGFDLEANKVEGVSGATWTSMAVARGVIETARKLDELPTTTAAAKSKTMWRLTGKDLGTLAFLCIGTLLAFSPVRGNGRLRVLYQLGLVGYVGFLNGDLISQAMLVGWVQHGIPGSIAVRLIVMVGIAVTVPVIAKRNVYCSHLCSYGALQQLVRNRIPQKVSLSKRLRIGLQLIPGVLLLWVATVALFQLPFSLVDIEPFDAFVFQIAGWATFTIFGVGLIVSCFVPMAYCRFGCPTGSLLEYLRRNRRSDRLGWSDAFSLGILLLALSLLLGSEV